VGWPGMSVWPARVNGDFVGIQEDLEASGIRGHATGSVRGEGLG
jgi:hypothetical protein